MLTEANKISYSLNRIESLAAQSYKLCANKNKIKIILSAMVFIINVRVSFRKNSADALEILDNNDYYPFGMSHLKTGISYFLQDSFMKYKYSLSSITLEPYGYEYNNPVLFSDRMRMSPGCRYSGEPDCNIEENYFW